MRSSPPGARVRVSQIARPGPKPTGAGLGGEEGFAGRCLGGAADRCRAGSGSTPSPSSSARSQMRRGWGRSPRASKRWRDWRGSAAAAFRQPVPTASRPAGRGSARRPYWRRLASSASASSSAGCSATLRCVLIATGEGAQVGDGAMRAVSSLISRRLSRASSTRSWSSSTRALSA